MKRLRPAVVSFLALSVLTGVGLPFSVAGVAWALFPAKAGGSLVRREGRVVGSRLVGQAFTDPGDFWGRPSVDGGPSNLAPSDPELRKAVAARVAALRAADPEQTLAVPVDLVTASGSGLDPHISPQAAAFQAGRVARARGLSEAVVRRLVAEHTEGPQWGVLGEARVDVLELNLALDALGGR